MSLSIGIVGLPNVGKSTLFNALLKKQEALAANYPFATIEPNIGVVNVPDDRLDVLSEVVRTDHGRQNSRGVDLPEKVTPAFIKFYDIAGLVKGASQGEGLGNAFLSHIREVDAILHLVRSFEDDNIIRADSTDPLSDIETINTELLLSDLETVKKRLEKLSPIKDKEMYNFVTHIMNELSQGKLASKIDMNDNDSDLWRELGLLTKKPIFYVFNVSEGNLDFRPEFPHPYLNISAKIESEICSLSPEEGKEYLSALGLESSGLDKVIRKCYELLDLQTYFTAGSKEVRAWTIKKDTKAPQAAGKIHTDFEKGFISAEVVAFEALKAAGSHKKAREQGLVRIEGKNYTMQDGDVVEFRFNV